MALDERGVIDHERWRSKRPGLRRLALMKYLRRNRQLDEAISLRSLGDQNYFHFLNDLVGGTLRLAHEAGVSDEVPLVISERMATQPFIAEIQGLPEFRDRQWFVQRSHEALRSKRLYFAESPGYSIEGLRFVQDALQVPEGDVDGDDRIVLVRRDVGRQFVNSSEVLDVCARHGFRPIETGSMSLVAQIELFSRVRFVIAAHGAGLFNLVFRRNAPLSLLELFPESPRSLGWIMAHYFYMCRVLGFDYHAMNVEVPAKETTRVTGHVAVDPVRLDESIRHMLANG